MKDFFSKWLLLAIVLASVCIFSLAASFNANLEIVVLALTVTTLILSLYLERKMPFSKAWTQQQGDTATDLTSAGFLLGITDPLLKFVAPLAVVSLYGLFSIGEIKSIFPTAAPFALQIIIATLVIEFLRYWAHRAHHSMKPLWWLHAMHHSSERLYTMNNFRYHPLNYTINFVLSVFPLMLIGVPSEVLFGYMAITQPILMLQHANIDLRNSWLNYVVSTNEIHRWHHSTKATEANANYGNALIVWDIVFKTFKYVKHANSPTQIGLFLTSKHYPTRASYLQQLRSAFSPECCKG
jgi:ornithine lipid hydroxylase